MKKIIGINFVILFLVFGLLILSGCSKNPTGGSIEEIQQQQSIDAKIKAQYQPDRGSYGLANFNRNVGDGVSESFARQNLLLVGLFLLMVVASVFGLIYYRHIGKVFFEWLFGIVGVLFLILFVASFIYQVPKVIGSSYDISEVFKDLPPLPEDFYKYKFLIMSGRADAKYMCDVPGEYFVQPEFYGDSFFKSGLNVLRNPNPDYWTPEGYGTFPHEMESVTSPGESFTVCTFFHASYGVETYQGFSLVPVYPGLGSVGGVTQSIDSVNSSKYISVDIVPDVVLLEPAYIIFSPGWTKRVVLNVNVRNDTPPGYYAIGFDVARAPVDKTRDWSIEYGVRYQSKSMISISEPQFVMVLKVE